MGQRGAAKKVVYGTLLGVAGSLIALALWLFGTFEFLENPTWSWRVRFFGKPGAATDRIKVLLFDQQSLDWGAKIDLTWPWPREVFTYVVNFLKRANAKVLVSDWLFSEPSPRVDDDKVLGEAFGSTLPVAQACYLGRTTVQATSWPEYVPRPGLTVEGLDTFLAERPDSEFWRPAAAFPVPEIAANVALLGNVRGEPDEDGVFRRASLIEGFDGHVVPALSLAAYLLGEASSPETTASIQEGVLRIGDADIPIDEDGRALLRFRGGPGSHQVFPVAAILQSELLREEGKEPTIDEAAFKDCYVCFGPSAPGLMDLKTTPTSRICPGVEVHATVLDNLLSEDFMQDAPAAMVIAVSVLLAVLGAIAIVLGKRAAHSVVALCLFLPIPLCVGFVTYPAGYWWPMVGPTMAVAFALVGGVIVNYATEGRQRKFIKRAFTHYLNRRMIERIIEDPTLLRLGGERRELTIFFSDLEKFSTISERLDPPELTALLNDYLTDMTDIIREEDGTLDKYQGDGIIAFWNAPIGQPDHAARALRAGIRCQRTLAERRDEFQRRTGAVLLMRVGIHTGPVVVGNMGSRDRFNYTVMGDAANLASRLEGANKAFGTYFMVSEQTWSQAAEGFVGRELGQVRVVGRTTPVRVFEPGGFAGEEVPEYAETFARGLAYCKRGEWSDALRAFESCEGDPAAAVYADRCRAQLEAPDGAAWDGVWNLTEK